MKGYINSIETMGLVDGPGVRFVVFLSGCPLRCVFCHNPETWFNKFSKEMTSFELFEKIKRFKPYFKNNGGVTFSGGEPLLQKDFLKEILTLLKSDGINTCLDTSGSVIIDDDLLDLVDLIILDIKDYRRDTYKDITGLDMNNFSEFLDLCIKKNKKLWLRQVVVPGINDNEEYMYGLKKFINNIPNVEKVELLPYHTMGVNKYNNLGISYKLKDVPDMDKNRCIELEKILTD